MKDPSGPSYQKDLAMSIPFDVNQELLQYSCGKMPFFNSVSGKYGKNDQRVPK